MIYERGMFNEFLFIFAKALTHYKQSCIFMLVIIKITFVQQQEKQFLMIFNYYYINIVYILYEKYNYIFNNRDERRKFITQQKRTIVLVCLI